MKKITRMIIFSAIALFLTTSWNKGFILNMNFVSYLKAIIAVSIIWYLVLPLSKIILFPLQILTMGFLTTIIYFLIFFFFITKFSFINITSWNFAGLTILGFTIQKMTISYTVNVFLSAFSISTIINLFESVV